MKIKERELITYPAARANATPTDLSEVEVKAVSNVVNPLIADAFALYVKTKNFHWHLSGPHFRDYHLLFDEQADSILDSVDILAERLRKIGSDTIRSIGHIAALQTIKDDHDTFVEATEMVKRLTLPSCNGQPSKCVITTAILLLVIYCKTCSTKPSEGFGFCLKSCKKGNG
jgi:DNA-binding ferritin-like protein